MFRLLIIKLYIMKKVFLPILSIFSLLISCDSAENLVEVEKPNQSNALYGSKSNVNLFSGKEIIEGIYLLHGDFVNKLPSLTYRRSLLRTPISDHEINDLHQFIENKYPSLYYDFESIIVKKDSYEIEELLFRTNKIIIEFAIEENNKEEIQAYLDFFEKHIDISNDPYFSSFDLSVHDDKIAFVKYLRDEYDISVQKLDKISKSLFARDGWAMAGDYNGVAVFKNYTAYFCLFSGIGYNDLYADKVLIKELTNL